MLLAAQARGVVVRGLWDALGAANGYSEDEALCQAGVRIKYEDSRGKMHHKYMVIDALGANPRVVTGSMNWSSAGNARNDENTLLLADPLVALAYAANFQSMWNAFGPATLCRLEHLNYLPLIVDNGGPGVQIASILYNPEGDDILSEQIVLHNVGGSAQEMAGWILSDEADNRYTFPALTLLPGASLTLWTKAGSDDDANLYWGRLGSAIWNNGGDIAYLRTAEQTIIDICSYEGGGVDINCR